MIVCSRCGFENEDSDTFCGSCASFLEWEGKRVAEATPEPEPEPQPEPEPEPEARAGLIDRVKDAIGIGDEHGEGVAQNGGAAASPVPTTAAPTPAASPSGSESSVESAPLGAGTAPTTGLLSAPPAGAPGRAVPPPPTVLRPGPQPVPPAPGPGPATPTAPPTVTPTVTPMGGTARTTTPVPPSPPAAPAGPLSGPAAVPTEPIQPGAVKPAAVKARPAPKKAAPAREINPGDKVCRHCGEGNDPQRRFCRRCGASLVEAAIFALPWYTRLWRRLTRPKQRMAGERPRSRRRIIGGHGGGIIFNIGKWVVLAAVLVVVILSFVGPYHHSLRNRESRYYHDVVGEVHPNYSAYHPTNATATSTAPGFPASNLINNADNTSWEANHAGVGQTVLVTFPGSANIAKVGFLNGNQTTPQAYLTEPRPAKVQLLFGGPHPYTKTVTLKDSPNFQTFTVSAKESTDMTLTIESVYPAQGGGANTSLTQIEFFTKS